MIRIVHEMQNSSLGFILKELKIYFLPLIPLILQQSCFVDGEFVAWLHDSSDPPEGRANKGLQVPLDPLTGKRDDRQLSTQ